MMEKRNEYVGEREENKCYSRRPLSNCISIDYQINKNFRRQTNDNERRYPPIILPSERISLSMKSSILPQYTSNPSICDQSTKQSTTNSISHAKSYGELNQINQLSLNSTNNDENCIQFQDKYSSNSPQIENSLQNRQTTITSPQTFSSPRKVPLWKRFKKMITPSKRQQSTFKIPTLLLDELDQSDVDSKTINLSKNPIKISELKTWLTTKTFPDQEIRDEYNKLPTDCLHPKTISARPENKMKNRFNSIEPYDHSRVILKTLSNDPNSDYINASYIDGYKINKFYIAAQAPTDLTLHDFIRMIWQLRIQTILMLTKLFEDGKHKCVKYWPDEGDKKVNNYLIHIDGEEIYANYIIRKLTIHNQFEPSEVLSIKQYHFLSWPDHDCLSLPTSLLEFRERFRIELKSSSPILVHCSAGVGRSGTFIALDSLLEAAKSEDTIDVLEFTHRMRQNRVHMIQTVDQYVFLYRAIIEGILTMNTSVSLQQFISTRKFHIDIKEQYKLLEQLQSNIQFSYRGAVEPENLNKNRFENILAPDNSRPYLMTQVDKTTDYINAVFVNSYRQSSNYIVTQYPLANTIIDFWRLVHDHNISIIMLLESIPRDPKNLPYWPSITTQNTSFGPFEITLLSQKEDDHLIERVLDLKYSQKSLYTNDRTKIVRLFQVKDNTRLLSIVKRFLKEMRTHNEHNVVLQCLNGATWSGYFLALCNAIDKMIVEQQINPFPIVRLIRANRKQFIDQNQYENLFLSMIDYAQQYSIVNTSSNRTVENCPYTNLSTGHDQSFINKR